MQNNTQQFYFNSNMSIFDNKLNNNIVNYTDNNLHIYSKLYIITGILIIIVIILH